MTIDHSRQTAPVNKNYPHQLCKAPPGPIYLVNNMGLFNTPDLVYSPPDPIQTTIDRRPHPASQPTTTHMCWPARTIKKRLKAQGADWPCLAKVHTAPLAPCFGGIKRSKDTQTKRNVVVCQADTFSTSPPPISSSPLFYRPAALPPAVSSNRGC